MEIVNRRTKKDEAPSAFMIDTGFSVSQDHRKTSYELAKSTILDSGATVHICNNRTRLKNFRKSLASDMLITGDSYLHIEGYGIMEITMKNGNSVRKIKL